MVGNLTTVSTPIYSPSGSSEGTQVTHYVHGDSAHPALAQIRNETPKIGDHDRIANHARDLLQASNSAIFLPDSSGHTYRAIVAIGKLVGDVDALAKAGSEGRLAVRAATPPRSSLIRSPGRVRSAIGVSPSSS